MTRIRFTVAAIARAIAKNPEVKGIVKKEGRRDGDWIWLSDATVRRINPDHYLFRPQVPITPRTEPLPRDQWPIWAKSLALLAKETDTGLGDVIERTIGPIGGETFKKWFKSVTGRDCGCGRRKEALNASWPLK